MGRRTALTESAEIVICFSSWRVNDMKLSHSSLPIEYDASMTSATSTYHIRQG